MQLLDTLALYGEDALQNHYQMIIPTFILADDIVNINLRVTGVDIPAQAIETYTITKNGKKLTRPSGISGQGNEFTFKYRPDKRFRNYNSIARWMGYIQNPSSLSMGGDSGIDGTLGASTYRVPITVLGVDANGIITNTWLFTGCWPSSQDALSFSEDTGEPFEVSVTMQYATIIYPTVQPLV